MVLPVETWHQAVFARTSRRTFDASRPVEPEKIDRLAEASASFRPSAEARVELVLEPPDDILRGVVGRYGKITGPPFYLAMIGRPGAPAVEEFVGYTGEGLVLEATALGLGTCWVSGFFRPEAVRRRLELSPAERVYAVSPLGYAAPSYSVKDRLFRRVAGSGQRKPLAELAAGGPLEGWPLKALEAARLAPSATNRQPWRFEVGDGSITVRIDGGREGGRFSKR
ncbi:MAG: nitroreductase, partial [Candidatus Aminicenantes bacterium]|nr:nitroreductase [Candidatus Aminicenantes bacterium]